MYFTELPEKKRNKMFVNHSKLPTYTYTNASKCKKIPSKTTTTTQGKQIQNAVSTPCHQNAISLLFLPTQLLTQMSFILAYLVAPRIQKEFFFSLIPPFFKEQDHRIVATTTTDALYYMPKKFCNIHTSYSKTRHKHSLTPLPKSSVGMGFSGMYPD